MTTAHGARSSSFLSPLSPPHPPSISTLTSVQLAMRTSLAVCYFQSIFFPLKDVAVLEVPGMGCTAPVDKYYLKAPPLKGKHKITQHLAFVAVFFFRFLFPLTS